MNTYTKICTICNTQFSYEQYPSVEKITNRLTCSEECRRKLVSKKLSGRYIPNPASTKQQNCWIEITCKKCGQTFTDHKCAKRIFCSIKCKANYQREYMVGKNNPHWKPKHEKSPYKNVCKSTRKRIIAERKYCEHCGIEINLQIHHIDRNRNNNSDGNLLLLCKNCHANEHERLGHINISHLILANHQGNTTPKYVQIPCKYCQKPFTPKTKTQKFCSVSCGQLNRHR